MPETHKPGKDGVLEDGVSHYPADAHDFQTYRDASQALSTFEAPLLLDSRNPHQRLYIAAFDGTGNDAGKDPEHATNVDGIRQQVRGLQEAGETRVGVGYVAGPGTQDGALARTWDGIRGHTYNERLEDMYAQFIVQAADWKRKDPEAQISVADVGFSRGAEQAAGFSRLVHERGIQDPSGAVYQRDSAGMIKGVEYTKAPIVAPGQVAQAVGLFDPVGTGEPMEKHDRRLPPSVISGVQIIAEDERRNLFKSTHIIDPGLSPDGRLLGVVVGGAHSDIGGSYHRNGMAVRSGNLMADYLNGLSDKPLLEKREEPTDPRLNVIHRSEEGNLLYRLRGKVDRTEPEGYVERLVPKKSNVADPNNAEPRDDALNRQFPRHTVAIGATPGAAPSVPTHVGVDPRDPTQPTHADYGMHVQIRRGVERLDASLGKPYDASSERLTESLLPLAKQERLSRVDHVVLSTGGPNAPPGEKVMVVQGDLADPAHRVAQMPTGAAVNAPIDQSRAQLAEFNARQPPADAPVQAPAQSVDPVQPAPRSHGALAH